MTPREIRRIPITWTNNKSQPILVSDFRDIDLTIVGTGTAGILGSSQATYDIPDFTASSTIDNSYTNIIIADLGVAGAYAQTLIVAGATKIGEVNANLLTWICVTRSADTLDGFITVCDNQ